ncbi:MAG: hypothetical protein R2873_05250 [Caldilineaceae bacterium]|nr:hypothetical protein [Caldilineaceae bacterium]
MDGEQKIQAYKQAIVDEAQRLRRQSDIGDGRISLYITDTPLVRGILHEHEADMRNRLNAVDIVQVEVDAGIPNPKEHPHRTFKLGEDEVTIAMEEA